MVERDMGETNIVEKDIGYKVIGVTVATCLFAE
jgi:hypothetical protein